MSDSRLVCADVALLRHRGRRVSSILYIGRSQSLLVSRTGASADAMAIQKAADRIWAAPVETCKDLNRAASCLR
jgi:hypothetical protein